MKLGMSGYAHSLMQDDVINPMMFDHEKSLDDRGNSKMAIENGWKWVAFAGLLVRTIDLQLRMGGWLNWYSLYTCSMGNIAMEEMLKTMAHLYFWYTYWVVTHHLPDSRRSQFRTSPSLSFFSPWRGASAPWRASGFSVVASAAAPTTFGAFAARAGPLWSTETVDGSVTAGFAIRRRRFNRWRTGFEDGSLYPPVNLRIGFPFGNILHANLC